MLSLAVCPRHHRVGLTIFPRLLALLNDLAELASLFPIGFYWVYGLRPLDKALLVGMKTYSQFHHCYNCVLAIQVQCALFFFMLLFDNLYT